MPGAEKVLTVVAGFFPGRAPIDSYGAGGFRFAGMGHVGSIIMLPTGIRAWSVTDGSGWTPADFEPVFAARADIDFLLFGTGATQIFPDRALLEAFADRDLGLEVMSTASAARTYNVLLGEDRRVGAALIAVA